MIVAAVSDCCCFVSGVVGVSGGVGSAVCGAVVGIVAVVVVCLAVVVHTAAVRLPSLPLPLSCRIKEEHHVFHPVLKI